MYKLRKAFIRFTGYWIYKKKHLSTGVDFIIDIENHFPAEFHSIKTVIDVGANIGQSAQKFAEELKQSQIYSFEPESHTYEQLQANTNQLPNVSCFHMGLGEQNDKMELHHGKYSAWNSLVPGINKTGEKSWVDIKKLDDVVKELGIGQIDLLKTDTEGYDIKVLKGASNLLEQGHINFIYIESGFYDSNKRNTNLNEIMSYLLDYDFFLFALYEVSKGGSYLVNGNALFVHKSIMKEQYEMG